MPICILRTCTFLNIWNYVLYTRANRVKASSLIFVKQTLIFTSIYDDPDGFVVDRNII